MALEVFPELSYSPVDSPVLNECIRVQNETFRLVSKDYFQNMLQHILRFPEKFIAKYSYTQMDRIKLQRFSIKLSKSGSWGNGVFIEFCDISPQSHSQLHLTGQYNFSLFFEDVCICTCGIIIEKDTLIINQIQASCLDTDRNNFLVSEFDWVNALLALVEEFNAIALQKPNLVILPRDDLEHNSDIYTQRPKVSGFRQMHGMLQKRYYSIDEMMRCEAKKKNVRSTEVSACSGCFNFMPDAQNSMFGECMYDMGTMRSANEKTCPRDAEPYAITDAERKLRELPTTGDQGAQTLN